MCDYFLKFDPTLPERVRRPIFMDFGPVLGNIFWSLVGAFSEHRILLNQTLASGGNHGVQLRKCLGSRYIGLSAGARLTLSTGSRDAHEWRSNLFVVRHNLVHSVGSQTIYHPKFCADVAAIRSCF